MRDVGAGNQQYEAYRDEQHFEGGPQVPDVTGRQALQVRLYRALKSGYKRARFAHMDFICTSARSIVTPGRKRPMTRRKWKRRTRISA